MSTDNKTLADVKPGGRVRLGDAPWPEIDAILADAYSAGAEGLPFEGIARRAAVRAAVAALSAQPSPGAQDPLASLPLYRLADDANGNRGLHRDDTGSWVKLQDVERALASRQPVEFERTVPTRRRESAVELLLTLGFVWNNQRWEDRRQPAGVPAAWMHTHKATGRVEFGLSPMYDCDFNAVQWDSVALYAAPAQAVDLGRWSQRHADDLHVAVHTALSVHAGSLSQKKRAAISAYVKRLLIDSQAVGNG